MATSKTKSKRKTTAKKTAPAKRKATSKRSARSAKRPSRPNTRRGRFMAWHDTHQHVILRTCILLLKFVAVLFIAFSLFLVFVYLIFGRHVLTEPDDIVWGTTWSNLAAEELGLDPEVAYAAVVEDLRPSRLRLIAYWNRTEAERDDYDFSELDYQVSLAEQNNIPFVIAVGNRVPRYPECHTPEWANHLSGDEYETALLDFVEATIERYDNSPYISAWQIENEAYVGSFGICPTLDEDLLKRELDLARSLTEKDIVLTESGELSLWFKASGHPDIMGTTLYRAVIIGKTNIVVRHVFPPWYYRARSNIVKLINGNLDNVIVAELQGEPWASKPIIEADPEQITATMNIKQFEHNIEFTESVGFPEVWWWGVEWWYYERENGEDYYWERARDLFRQTDST